MKNRNILFTGPSVAAIVEDEIGAPKANEVQVRLAVSTISSGTERANLVGDPNVNMGAVVQWYGPDNLVIAVPVWLKPSEMK